MVHVHGAGEEAKSKAMEIRDKHNLINDAYQRVHKLVSNCDAVTDDHINQAELAIRAYLVTFRELIGIKRVSPKQHYLESHIIPFMRKYRHGMALHGEQGLENAHHAMNLLRKQSQHIPSTSQQFTYEIKQHLKFCNTFKLDPKE